MNQEQSGPASVEFKSNAEVAIHVPDLDVARAFYEGVLGFRMVSRTADYLELDSGALRLYVNRDEKDIRSFIPSLDVPNLTAAKEHLANARCETVALESGGMYFKDPFGLVFDIIQR
jgi:catechol 2,3-dioxygenase-like lactoylglutathione lyase family enzyme